MLRFNFGLAICLLVAICAVPASSKYIVTCSFSNWSCVDKW